MKSLKTMLKKADDFIATGGRLNFWLAVTFGIFAACLLLSGCANHCRIDQRVPEGETFESAERLTKEQCK